VSDNNDREVQSLNRVDVDLNLSFMSGIKNLESTLTDTDIFGSIFHLFLSFIPLN